MAETKAPIPLTVIGGFLGAGKTTLLNRLLTETGGIRFAVLVNDFGALAIDGDLVTEHGGDTLTFANGCLCCSIGDSLIATLDDLVKRPDPPEHIVVEASGVADPRQIADVGTLHPGLTRDLTVVLVDSETIRARAEDPRLADTVARQLESAEILVLNKGDLVTAEERRQVRDWIVARAPTAAVVETEQARLPLDLLLAQEREGRAGEAAPADAAAHAQGHGHRAVFRSLVLPAPRPLDLEGLRAWLEALPASVLRVKGFVRAGEGLHLVQRSGRRLQIAPWRGTEAPRPALVVVGLHDMPGDDWFEAGFGGLPESGS